MPITQSAKQALRKDQRRTLYNLRRKRAVKKAIDQMKEKPSPEALTLAFSKIDKMVKYNLYHKNKASRIKSQLSKLIIIKPKVAKSKSTSKVKAQS